MCTHTHTPTPRYLQSRAYTRMRIHTHTTVPAERAYTHMHTHTYTHTPHHGTCGAGLTHPCAHIHTHTHTHTTPAEQGLHRHVRAHVRARAHTHTESSSDTAAHDAGTEHGETRGGKSKRKERGVLPWGHRAPHIKNFLHPEYFYFINIKRVTEITYLKGELCALVKNYFWTTRILSSTNNGSPPACSGMSDKPHSKSFTSI